MYTALAVLAAVLVTAAMLLAAPALSQPERTEKDPERTRKATTEEGPAQEKSRMPDSRRTAEAKTEERSAQAERKKSGKHTNTASEQDPIEGAEVYVDEDNGTSDVVDDGDVLLILGNYEVENPSVAITDGAEEATFDDSNAVVEATSSGDIRIKVDGATRLSATDDLTVVESTGVRRADANDVRDDNDARSNNGTRSNRNARNDDNNRRGDRRERGAGVDCLQILKLKTGDQYNSQISGDVTGGAGGAGGTGGEGGDATATGPDSDATGGTGGEGGEGGEGGNATNNQYADFGDQPDIEQIQNCNNRDVLRVVVNEDDDSDDAEEDEDEGDPLADDDSEFQNLADPDGEVLDTSGLKELPLTGGPSLFGDALTVGLVLLLSVGTGASLWLGIKRGRSDD